MKRLFYTEGTCILYRGASQDFIKKYPKNTDIFPQLLLPPPPPLPFQQMESYRTNLVCCLRSSVWLLDVLLGWQPRQCPTCPMHTHFVSVHHHQHKHNMLTTTTNGDSSALANASDDSSTTSMSAHVVHICGVCSLSHLHWRTYSP
jgi:hypothetical protein